MVVDFRNHPFAPELPPPWKWFEVVPFMALGIAGGLVGAVPPPSKCKPALEPI